MVAIIDAFHFDVSSTNDDDLSENDWKALSKRTKPSEKLQPEIARRRPEGEGEGEGEEENQDDELELEGALVEKEQLEDNDGETIGSLPSKALPNLSIRRKIIEYLLPRLKDCATAKDLHNHRKAQAGKTYCDDDHIQRAPIALATVKLLMKMPQRIIDEHLHGVILKLCILLMSRSINVRDVARKTIISVVETLGPNYLPFVIKEMKMILSKGYQVHVMIFTIHALILAMQSKLASKSLDPCLDEIMQVCQMDLFGDTADEKEITGITKDVPEAKANRTFDTYTLMGRFIGPQSMAIVLKPLKEVIETKPTAKTIKQVGQLLRHFAIGLCANEGVDHGTMLIFAYQILSSHIDEVISANKPKNDRDDGENLGVASRREKSCLLLEKEPTRIGVIVKTSVKSRMYVFVEFALQILASILKSKKLQVEDDSDNARLDPFVVIVSKCLQLKYDKLISNALRCFISLLQYPLPSLRTHMSEFVDRLFILLADYAAMGEAGNHGAVLELSQILFKAFTHMIKDAPDLMLSSKRLQLLLNYVETDVVDSQKQATAFPLIKAIIARKLQDTKVVELMKYLAEIAITSQLAHIRTQCRQVLVQFIGNHPQSGKPKEYVNFFVAQLEYEYEDGRVSAIEMLNSLFDSFTMNVNDHICLLALVNLSVRLVNDKSAKCRRMVALAIRKLFSSISDSKLNDSYLVMRDWLEANKEQSRCIAMQMFVEMAEVHAELISAKLDELLPFLEKILQPILLEQYTEITITKIIDSLSVIVRKCEEAAKNAIALGLFDEILKNLENFAKCLESQRIQLSTSRLIGQLLASIGVDLLTKRNNDCGKDLLQWSCWQLKNRMLDENLAEQASKNIAFLSITLDSNDDLKWLCEKLCSICKYEIVHEPTEALKRLSIFKLAAALAIRVDPSSQLSIVIDTFIPLVHREMMGKSSQNTEQLQQVASEVAEIFKEKIGEQCFTAKLVECQKMAFEKTENRKRQQKEEAVIDPARTALRKLKRTKAKAEAKKRKLDTQKPHRAIVRKRQHKNDDD